MTYKFRSPAFQNEPVITSFGVLNLDANGFVTNQEELGISDEDMSGIPGLVSNEDFPLDQFPIRALPPEFVAEEVKEAIPPDDASVLTPTELVVLTLLREKEGTHFNSQGNLDMSNLNTKLVEVGLTKVTGAERDAIVAKVKDLVDLGTTPEAPVVDPEAPVVDPEAPVVDPEAPVVDPV